MIYKTIHPKAWSSATHDPESRPTCEVWLTNREPRDTGLIDANGISIYRIPEEIPFGFSRK